MFSCPQCAEPTETLYEGVCEPCREQNQQALDLHNAEYDRWQKLSDNERATMIRRAARMAI